MHARACDATAPTNRRAGIGLRCPDAALRAKVLRGINSGAITWHAHPHNAQYELYDVSLLEGACELVGQLDDQFGLRRKATAILVRRLGQERQHVDALLAACVCWHGACY